MINKDEINKLVEIMDYVNNKAKDLFSNYIKNDDIEINKKPDGSMVTNIDKEIHNILLEEMSNIFKPKKYLILSEEQENPKYNDRKNKEYIWIIDPIDGTHDMIDKKEDFTICIGLLYKNQPIFGIVGLPMKNLIIYGGRDLPIYIVEEKIHFKIIPIFSKNKKDNEIKFTMLTSNGFKEGDTNIWGKYIKSNNYYGLDLITTDLSSVIMPLNTWCEYDICAWQAILQDYFHFKSLTDLNDIKYNTPNLSIPPFIIYPKDSRWIFTPLKFSKV